MWARGKDWLHCPQVRRSRSSPSAGTGGGGGGGGAGGRRVWSSSVPGKRKMERHTHKIISVDFNHFENTEVNRLWKKRSKRSAVATDTTLMAQMGHISRKTRQRPAHRMSEVTSDLLEALNRTVRPKKKTVAPPTAQQHRRGVKVSVSLVRSNDAKRLSQKLTTSFTQPRYNPARSAVGGGGKRRRSDWSALICSYKLP